MYLDILDPFYQDAVFEIMKIIIFFMCKYGSIPLSETVITFKILS